MFVLKVLSLVFVTLKINNFLFLLFERMPWNFRTFSEFYLGTIWCGQLVLIDVDVTMATNLWQAVFQKIENSCFKMKKKKKKEKAHISFNFGTFLKFWENLEIQDGGSKKAAI